MAASFFDSNVVLYLASDPEKAAITRGLLECGGIISVQVLNEVANVSLRKMGKSWSETEDLLSILRSLLDVRDLRLADHQMAIRIAQRYRIGFYDALIVASAVGADCEILYSENMHDGLVVEGRLAIVNPYARR